MLFDGGAKRFQNDMGRVADQQQVKKAISLLLASYPRANGGDQDSMRQYLVLVENFLIQYPTDFTIAAFPPANIATVS